MTHVNDSPVNEEDNTAYGGEKQSGLGRFGGPGRSTSSPPTTGSRSSTTRAPTR